MIDNTEIIEIPFIAQVFNTVIFLIPLLVTVAFFTLLERKGMASIQRRKGPNMIGFWGFLQPLADGLKLIIKEMVLPRKSNTLLFLIAPMITFFFKPT